MAFWLLKTEPDTFSIDDLKKAGTSGELWDGVRNYQARNFLKLMKPGDQVLVYHSSCKEPAIAGLGEISAEAIPDPTQFEVSSDYYDARATRDKPLWYAPRIRFVRKFEVPVTLKTLKSISLPEDFPLIRKGSRLSVMPVPEEAWNLIMQLAEKEPEKN